MAHHLGRRLREARMKAGLTTRELDVAAGLTPGHVWQIESGARKSPTIATLSAIARALGVSVDSLLEKAA